MRTIQGLSVDQRAHYVEHGFVRLPGFEDPASCRRMLDRVVEIARSRADRVPGIPGLVLPESNLATPARTDGAGDPDAASDPEGAGPDAAGPGGADPARQPEDLVAKVFGLHRDGVFAEFAARPAVTDLLVDLIGPSLDCFLSQFIFKNPGAWGQPWHQDSFYFPFDPPRPIVGVWLAVTEATLENGCLHVLPGSHREPVHEHVADRRPGANYGYVEIVDHDMGGATPVLMDPGDLLLFDSHLMHRSTDNGSAGRRAAMVYHYAATGTVDHGRSRINDFVSVR